MPQAARRARLEAGNWNLSPSGGAQASSAGMERGRASVARAGWAVVMEEEPAQRLVCRRRGLRKRHQDDRHRDAADLTAHVEQRTASDSTPGGRLPAGLRANANPFAERLPEHLDRQVGIGIRDDILERARNAMGPIRPTKHASQRADAVDAAMVDAKPGDV